MTLVIVIKNRAGLVLAADTALTCSVPDGYGGIKLILTQSIAKKILYFEKPHNFVAAVTYGRATIKSKTPSELGRIFEKSLHQERLPVKKITEELSTFLMEKWDHSADKKHYKPKLEEQMQFYVAGFDKNEPYGCVYHINIPEAPTPLQIRACNDAELLLRAAGYRENDVQSHLENDEEKIRAASLREAAAIAESTIQIVISQQTAGDTRVVEGPVIVCTITADSGLKCDNDKLRKATRRAPQ
jgi:hypothetical protein